MNPNRAPEGIASFHAADLPPHPGGIVIVGAGLAGLFTALKLSPLPVTVVAGAPLGAGASSVWAQGGIAAALGADDSPEAHAADTIRAGGGLVDEAVARFVAEEASGRIRELGELGVPFDRDEAGRFLLSREAAHSAARIARVSGDRAGSAIMHALIATVRRTPSIRVIEGFEAADLHMSDGSVDGVILRCADPADHSLYLLSARATVLATGGIGHLYATTTNPPHSRGEAIAFAARAGAVIADAEFVQFHPTAIDVGADPAPLATEALRGEGAVLIDGSGHRFMTDVHPDAELAPRDIVARAVFAEIEAGRGAFLDCRRAIGARFPQAFPTVYARCQAAGFDPVTAPIPVAPAAHYHMGGIWTGELGRTTLPGLWAVGEVASTGLHGANRLASNSLLEAVVFAARAARDIAELCPEARPFPLPESMRAARSCSAEPRDSVIAQIRRAMTSYAGVVRSGHGLKRALDIIETVARRNSMDGRVCNMTLTAKLVVAAALKREESRGAHFRSDFPLGDGRHGRRSFAKVEGGRIVPAARDRRRKAGETVGRTQ